jgi:hypothetical protein
MSKTTQARGLIKSMWQYSSYRSLNEAEQRRPQQGNSTLRTHTKATPRGEQIWVIFCFSSWLIGSDILEVSSEHIRGTPGEVEILDSRMYSPPLYIMFLLIAKGYNVKYGPEEYRFFKQGRVFAMLWTEIADENLRRQAPTDTDNSRMTELRYPDPAMSSGRSGQDVLSQIRRFVIVKINRKAHFVFAW